MNRAAQNPKYASHKETVVKIQTRTPIAIVVVLATLAFSAGFVDAASPTTPKREIAGEAFAAYASTVEESHSEKSLITAIEFPAQEAKFVQLLIRRVHGGQPCIDEMEIYGPDSPKNLALADAGARAHASASLEGYEVHALDHINDGLYGNENSWIAGSAGEEWVSIELPEPVRVSKVLISRDRNAQYFDRQILKADVRVSLDGDNWKSVAKLSRNTSDLPIPSLELSFPLHQLDKPTWEGAVRYAFLREFETWNRMDRNDYLSPFNANRPAVPNGEPYWGDLVRLSPVERVVFQFEEMIQRLEVQGLNLDKEKAELAALRQKAQRPGASESEELFVEAREAKRRLFFRDPKLAPAERVLFAKRHPLHPSHNYSDHMDSIFVPGGGLCVLHVPRDGDGRLEPARAVVETLFDGSDGIVRHPVADYEARTIYFAYRPDQPTKEDWRPYWHLMSIGVDGTGLTQLTDGPYHDFDPTVLPDGDIAFMSTRCEARFLCWEPQAYVLYRMSTDGSNVRRLSHANLSEWDPSVMTDGRILWTRSEYQDKGADFGHTLWAIRPDGTQPELVFGNNTPYGYGHGREVPGSLEIVTTIISHGDHQGPIALLDPSKGLFNTAAITNITPDTRPQYQMDRSHIETFRDPVPLSPDHFLVTHAPGRVAHWGIYIIDRYGNRELLYLDPRISSKRPSPLTIRTKPPVLPENLDPVLAEQGLGLFAVQDVYEGLGSSVPRGQAKYIQVSQELPAKLLPQPDGEFPGSHPGFQDYYATPIHYVSGPPQSYLTRTSNALGAHAYRTGSAKPAENGAAIVQDNWGWPSYVAKTVHGVVPIHEDGSANFTAPAGEVLYFHLLDENFNEIQRMRSVVQLQPGERRSCVGCHEDRLLTPSIQTRQGLNQPPVALTPPPWGARPFDYEDIVQPVLDANCVRCHNGTSDTQPNLRGKRDEHRVPTSYRSLISGGYVHYFDWIYGSRHLKAEPLSFGSTQSRLFEVLKMKPHEDVQLKPEEMRAIKAWIDLNCPLWPNYTHLPERSL